MRFSVILLSLEWPNIGRRKNGDALPVWGHEINEWPFASWTQTTAFHSWTEIVRVLVHAAIKRLPVINTSPLHMQSTHGAAHNNPGSKRRGEKKSWIANLLLYHRRHWNYVLFRSHQPLFLSAACVIQTVGDGRRGQEGEDFWKTLSHSLEWWHGSNETEERDAVL